VLKQPRHGPQESEKSRLHNGNRICLKNPTAKYEYNIIWLLIWPAINWSTLTAFLLPFSALFLVWIFS
jgi:hypothetical protein